LLVRHGFISKESEGCIVSAGNGGIAAPACRQKIEMDNDGCQIDFFQKRSICAKIKSG
jgi:hypothetical protein